MHKNSAETRDFIADWISPDFFFSKNDKWGRMGILGVFGDMALTCLPVGGIVEIGCGESSIYLSHLARKFNRVIYHCDIAPDKIINPVSAPGYMFPQALDILEPKKLFTFGKSNFFMGSSDDLFAQHIRDTHCLAFTFIDGDHIYGQAKKDFDNAVSRTVDNGYIFLHDTLPPSEKYLCPDSACGDVYKLRQEIEADKRFDSISLPHGVAMDVGITIVRVKPRNLPYYQE